MGFIEWIKRQYSLLFVFDSRDRATFAEQFHMMIENGKTVTNVLYKLKEVGFTKVVKQIADESIQHQIQTQQRDPIASTWYHKGYFPLVEATLLTESQRLYGDEGLSKAFKLIAESNADAISFLINAVLKNLVFIIAAIAAIVGYIYFGQEGSKLLGALFQNTTPPKILVVSEIIDRYKWIIFVTTAILVVSYFYFRHTITTLHTRYRCNKLGLFLVHDLKFQYDVCSILASFFAMGINSLNSLTLLTQVFSAGYQNKRLEAARQSVAQGAGINQALKQYVLDPRVFGYVEGYSNGDSSKELSTAYGVTTQLLGKELGRLNTLAGLYIMLTGASLLLSFVALFIQLLPELQQATRSFS